MQISDALDALRNGHVAFVHRTWINYAHSDNPEVLRVRVGLEAVGCQRPNPNSATVPRSWSIRLSPTEARQLIDAGADDQTNGSDGQWVIQVAKDRNQRHGITDTPVDDVAP